MLRNLAIATLETVAAVFLLLFLSDGTDLPRKAFLLNSVIGGALGIYGGAIIGWSKLLVKARDKLPFIATCVILMVLSVGFAFWMTDSTIDDWLENPWPQQLLIALATAAAIFFVTSRLLENMYGVRTAKPKDLTKKLPVKEIDRLPALYGALLVLLTALTIIDSQSPPQYAAVDAIVGSIIGGAAFFVWQIKGRPDRPLSIALLALILLATTPLLLVTLVYLNVDLNLLGFRDAILAGLCF